MANSIKEKIKSLQALEKTPLEGHEARFLNKLNQHNNKRKRSKLLLNSAALIIVLIGIGFLFLSKNLQTENIVQQSDYTEDEAIYSGLADVSPELGALENAYIEILTKELETIEVTEENKVILDKYLVQLQFLEAAYDDLLIDLNLNGPTEPVIAAMIDNLQLKLNVLKELKKSLNTLKNQSHEIKKPSQI